MTACTGVASSPSSTPATSISSSAAPAGVLPAELQAKLNSALADVMSTYRVPGAAVGVWVPGVGSWTKAAGLADVEKKIPVSIDMSWPLRSVTKSFTVTVILQLVDEGRLRLDDTLDTYVPGVTDGDKITIRELANMSSGNADSDFVNDSFVREFSKDPDKIFTLKELNGLVMSQPAQFAPGTRRVYTNANTNLLGAVIEKVTGKPFADVLKQDILQQVGLDSTHYILNSKDWTQPHAGGYIVGPDGPEAQPQNMSIFGPAGSMVTTLDDARVWGDTLAEGLLLSPATQTQRELGAPLEVGPPYDLYALGMGETDGYWGHNGEGIGFTAAVFHSPTTGATIAVFMNESDVPTSGGDDAKVHPADKTFRAFAQILKTEVAK
jgi:D-alanyl-D-alanine carboxypeptidase